MSRCLACHGGRCEDCYRLGVSCDCCGRRTVHPWVEAMSTTGTDDEDGEP